jgi:hypothetical protein
MATQPARPARSADPTVEAELDRLAVMPIAQLRVRYREVGPIPQRRSARICSGAASHTGFRRRPMAASHGPRNAYSIR